jgi:hypothetical protein
MPASWKARALRHKPATVVTSVLILAVAAGVTIAIAGPGGGPGGATTASASRLFPADPPQPAVTKGARWLKGPAGTLLGAVNVDVGRINVDHQARNASAARRDGARLVTDAAAALRGPMPPVDAILYRSALRDFQQAGTDTASGNFSAASVLVGPASVRIATVTSAVNPASPVGSPAGVRS